MKRIGPVFIVIALLVTTLQVSANAAVKAGANCTKAGIKKVDAAGKTLTCLKVGKKLTWNKAAVIPVVKQSPAPTPATSVAPVAVIPDMPTSFDDLVKNYKGISYAAWSKSRAKIIASTKTDFNYQLVLGPNSQLTNKDPLTAFNLVTRLYSGYTKSGDVYLLAFNFEDRDWAVKQMDSIIPTAGSRWIYDVACATKTTCDGGGSFFDGSKKHLVVETMVTINENTTTGTLEAHEFTHSVQQMAMGSARPATEFITAPWLPNWYWEGQARFAQNATIWFESFDSYLRLRNATSGGVFQDSKYDSKYIEEYFVINPNREWGNKHARQRQYDLGGMFIEILTALKGPDSTMEMWKLAGTGVGLESAFEKVYGIPFTKALPIMSKAIALELGRS
jgi:hypothetical protein